MSKNSLCFTMIMHKVCTQAAQHVLACCAKTRKQIYLSTAGIGLTNPFCCMKTRLSVNIVYFSTDDKPNRRSSSYTSLFAIYFEVPLVAVRLNYKSVIESCVFTDHSIQNIIHFRIIIIALFISDEQFLCSAFSKYSLDICTMLFFKCST